MLNWKDLQKHFCLCLDFYHKCQATPNKNKSVYKYTFYQNKENKKQKWLVNYSEVHAGKVTFRTSIKLQIIKFLYGVIFYQKSQNKN